MPFSPDLTSVKADSALDEFRDSIAEVWLGNQIVGYLATRVEGLAESIGGHLWWTRWSEPREVVEYVMTRTDDSSPLPEWDDNIDVFGHIVEELRTGQTTYIDHRVAGSGSWDGAANYTYTLTWIDGDQRTKLWARYGFDE